MWVWLLQEIVKSPLIRPLMHFLLNDPIERGGRGTLLSKPFLKHVLNQLVLMNNLGTIENVVKIHVYIFQIQARTTEKVRKCETIAISFN